MSWLTIITGNRSLHHYFLGRWPTSSSRFGNFALWSLLASCLILCMIYIGGIISPKFKASLWLLWTDNLLTCSSTKEKLHSECCRFSLSFSFSLWIFARLQAEVREIRSFAVGSNTKYFISVSDYTPARSKLYKVLSSCLSDVTIRREERWLGPCWWPMAAAAAQPT